MLQQYQHVEIGDEDGAGGRRLPECRATRTSTLMAPTVPKCPEQPLPAVLVMPEGLEQRLDGVQSNKVEIY